MDRADSSTPEATSPTSPHPQPAAGSSGAPPSDEGGHHDFDAQKRIHQQIRNDPDYDDWEYGTEPLPHEAWLATNKAGNTAPPSQENP